MSYLKRFIFTMAFLFLVVGYAAQNTMVSEPRTVNNKQQLIFQVIGNEFVLNKADIKKIQLQDEQTQSIEIQMTDDAAKRFHDFSAKYIGERMQMVWNGTILSDAPIMSALPGNMEIQLDVDRSVAQDMVSNL